MKSLHGKSYLEQSRNWLFHLYTVREVQLMLRLTDKALMKIRKETGIEPHRRILLSGKNKGKPGPRKFFTDYQVKKIIDHLFHDLDGKI